MKHLIKLLVVFFAVLSLCFSGAVAQTSPTPAGTSIPNIATGSYTDAGGNTVLIFSNQAIITVASVCGVSVLPHGSSLAPGQSSSVTPGGTTYLSYSLTNTGNNDYAIALTPNLESGSTFTPAALSVFLDANNDLQPDGTAITSLNLTASEITHVLVRVDAPAPLEGDLIANINLSASCPGGPSDSNNIGRVTSSARADLSLAKTHTGDLVIGQITPYTLQVSNAGPSSANDTITVTDTLPAGLEFISGGNAEWVCGVLGQIVTCTRPNALANGANSSFNLNLKVLTTAGSSLINTASVSSSTIDPQPSNNTSTDTANTTVSDLVIIKNHNANFIRGVNGVYTIQIRNIGTAATIGNVSITDTIPTGLNPLTATGTGWACSINLQTVSCNRSDALPINSSYPDVLITVAVAQNAANSITNTAAVAGGGEVNFGNDIANDTVSILSSSDVSIQKTDNASTAVPGTSLSYTITVQNAGPSNVTGVAVLDNLPTSLSNATWTCAAQPGSSCATSGSGNINELVNLPANSSLVFTITSDLSSSATGDLVNTASVVVPSSHTDLNLANNTSTDTDTLIPSSDLSITKVHVGTFTVGINGVYILGVANTGPSSVAGTITVTDNLPAGLGFISATGTAWTCSANGSLLTCTHAGSLEPNTALPDITLTVSVGAAALPSVTNTANVSSATPDPKISNNSASDTTNVVFVEPFIGPLGNANALEYPDASDKQNLQSYQAQTIRFTQTVLNAGNTSDTLNIALETPLPSGWIARWLASDGTPLTDTNNDGFIDVGLLAPGGSINVILELQPPTTTFGDNGGMGWNWVAHVASSVKPDAINRTLDVVTQIKPATDAWQIIKTVLPVKTLKPGDTLTYSLDITNKTDFSQSNVVVTDTLDPNLAAPFGITTGLVTDANNAATSYTITGIYNPTTRTITWKLENLKSLGRFKLSFKTTILATTPDATIIPNTASVSSDTLPVAVASNRVESGVIGAVLVVEKLALQPTVSIGGTVDFELRIMNNSPTAGLADLVVTDDLPLGLAYKPGSSKLAGLSIPDPVITTLNGKQTLVWKIAKLEAKSRISVVFTCIGLPSMPNKVINTVIVTAHAEASDQIVVVSNTASAGVKLGAGIFSPRSVLVGQVYFDNNDNQRFDAGQDEVLPNARVYLSNGTYAITDTEGRYSFPDLAPGLYAVRLDPLTVPYVPKPIPEDQSSPGTRYARLTGTIEVKDFLLYPTRAAGVKSRSTTVKRGAISLTKKLEQGGAGYGVQMTLTIDRKLQNILISDPLPTGGTENATRAAIILTTPDGTTRVINLDSDGNLILGTLEPGVYTITYALFSDLDPEYALTDPDIDWEEVEK